MRDNLISVTPLTFHSMELWKGNKWGIMRKEGKTAQRKT